MQSKIVIAVTVFLLGAGVGVAVMFLDRGTDAAESGSDGLYRIVNPLAQVEVGEWALYRLGDGKTMRLEVKAVSRQTKVVTLFEEYRDPRTNVVAKQDTRRLAPNHFLFGFDGVGALVARIYEDPITVAGRTFQSFCVETSGGTMGPVRHWYSPEVPVIGLIKQERVEGGPDAIHTELIDWSGRNE